MKTPQELAAIIRNAASKYEQGYAHPLFHGFPNKVCVLGLLLRETLPEIAQGTYSQWESSEEFFYPENDTGFVMKLLADNQIVAEWETVQWFDPRHEKDRVVYLSSWLWNRNDDRWSFLKIADELEKLNVIGLKREEVSL